MLRVIQSEWVFIRRVTWDIGDLFTVVEKMIRENIFASSFLRKYENPLPRRRSSKYDFGQEIWTGTPTSSDVGSGEVLKLHTRERITDTGRDRRGGGFSNSYHLWTLSEEQRDRKESRTSCTNPDSRV